MFIIFAPEKSNRLLMSPRPKNIRKVHLAPVVSGLKPIGKRGSCKQVVLLHFEEYEALRLCDYEQLTQQEACGLMGVSRPTFSRIYTAGRQKLVQALVLGQAIVIDGGTSYTNSQWFSCLSCGLQFNNIRPVIQSATVSCPQCGSSDIRLIETNQLDNKKDMKKIAIPTRGNVVDDHFGHCEFYTILTISQENQILSSETIPSPQGCGCKSNIAGRLEEMGVTVMLAGNMGPGALNKLSAHHIEVIRGCKGQVLQVAEDYLSGKLSDSGIGCTAHHSSADHQCGGHHHAGEHHCAHED